mmetsp:Transcript_2434/g.6713  ORF Transcript_2434/g.6713 Transcript_2434/m.6713 type:complete len:282 (+) Transcript_2434:965-1810(+)
MRVLPKKFRDGLRRILLRPGRWREGASLGVRQGDDVLLRSALEDARVRGRPDPGGGAFPYFHSQVLEEEHQEALRGQQVRLHVRLPLQGLREGLLLLGVCHPGQDLCDDGPDCVFFHDKPVRPRLAGSAAPGRHLRFERGAHALHALRVGHGGPCRAGRSRGRGGHHHLVHVLQAGHARHALLGPLQGVLGARNRFASRRNPPSHGLLDGKGLLEDVCHPRGFGWRQHRVRRGSGGVLRHLEAIQSLHRGPQGVQARGRGHRCHRGTQKGGLELFSLSPNP